MKIVRVPGPLGPTFARLKSNENQVELLDGNPFFGDASPTGKVIALESADLLAPVVPSKVFGIGDNFLADGEDRPAFSDPLVFLKPSTAVCGPDDPIKRPEGGGPLAFEGELAVVMRKTRGPLAPDEVEPHIFGYTIANDVSAQGWQKEDSQWYRAKGADTFCPLGPWIETDFTLEQASNLALETRLSGKLVQSSNTSRLKRPIAQIVSFLSHSFTFQDADVILMGTPAGAGPMKDGDVVEIQIEGLGMLRNQTVAKG